MSEELLLLGNTQKTQRHCGPDEPETRCTTHQAQHSNNSNLPAPPSGITLSTEGTRPRMKGLSMKFSVCSLHRGTRVLPHFHFPQRLRQGKGRALGVLVADLLPTLRLSSRRIGRGVRHLCLWRLSFMASPPTLTSLFISTNLQYKSLPFRWPQRLCRWADRLQAIPRRRAVVTTLVMLLEARSVSASPFRASIRPPLVELGPDHLDLHLMVVHFDEFPQFVRVFKPALPCRPSKIVPARLSPPTCKLACSLRARVRFSHGPQGGARARNTLASLASALSGMTKNGSLQLSWPPHVAHHQFHCFPSFFCHRAPLRPTRFDLEADIDDTEGTRTTR